MKAKMLKIAGVKSEKEFYKKFPDEGSFMKIHGKEFKKAMRESKMEKAQTGRNLPGAEELSKQLKEMYPATAKMPNINAMMKPVNVPQSALTPKQAVPMPKPKLGKAAQFIDPVMKIAEGIGKLKQQHQMVRGAKQMRDLTGLQSAAMASKPVDPIKNQYVTPWDKVIQPGEQFPSLGVGTDPLGQAQDGAEIGGNPTELMNTFAPNTIYTDMGYEPLMDSDQVKQYYVGGGIPMAQGGFDIEERQGGVGKFLGNIASGMQSGGFQDFMNQGGYNLLDTATTAITGEPDAGTDIGGGIGEALGTPFGPVGKAIGKTAGKLIGDLVDRSDVKIRRARQQTEKNVGSMMGSQFAGGLQGAFSANIRNGGDIRKAQKGDDLTKKDGKCAAEEARNKEYSALDKESRLADKEGMRAAIAEARAAVRQNEQAYKDYISERLTGYGEKMKQKEFDEAYNTFAAQNPELAKDRLLYTAATKEYNKVRRNPEYYMRNVLGKVSPNIDYNTLTLPQLMGVMKQGYGGGEGYINAWREGFPTRAIPQQQDGGQTSEYEWISHTWQPQVITHFGEHRLSDLLRPPHDADMLRAGGHLKAYTPPSEEAMYTGRSMMQMGGELETHWGGYAEPISYNPYLPDGGETVMFRGQSHDESDGQGNTGIGITFGENPVEVERNEPAIKLNDGSGGDSSLVVFGNLKVPNQFLSEIGDPSAKGKKFKGYVKDLSKKEQRQNKKIDRASQQLDDLDPNSPFDKLKLNSLQATLMGANMKLKEYAEFKQNAAAVQNAINDTAEEMGVIADDLAKGKVKIDKNAFQGEARYGTSIPKAENGRSHRAKINSARGSAITQPQDTDPGDPEIDETVSEEDLKRLNDLYEAAKRQKKGDAVIKFQKEFHRLLPKTALKYNKDTKFLTARAKSLGLTSADFDKIDINNPTGNLESKFLQGNEDEFFGKITEQYNAMAQKKVKKKEIPKPKELPTEKKEPVSTTTTTAYPITEQIRTNPYLDLLGQAIGALRPSDIEPLDPSQIMGETYALSQNQVEPVWAQKLRARLSIPYDISLQDIINENEATYRGQQKLFGYNPAAQSSLAASKYAANQKVLADQFRMNQAEKNRVYEQNRNILNEYDLRNMQILDTQYVRQNEALSKTKATTLAALNSISSKIAQNKLDNRKLAVYENLYNYRYDPNFRLRNYQLANWNIPTVWIGPDGKQYKMQPVGKSTPGVVGIGTTTPGAFPAQAPSQFPSTATPPFFPDQPAMTAEDIKDQYLYPNEEGRRGLSVKKKRDIKNSMVVRALKNI